MPRRKYGKLIKAINYPQPEECPVCKKGIKCPTHPGITIICLDHKLKHIIEKEKQLEEEKKRREAKEKEEDERDQFESMKELLG